MNTVFNAEPVLRPPGSKYVVNNKSSNDNVKVESNEQASNTSVVNGEAEIKNDLISRIANNGAYPYLVQIISKPTKKNMICFCVAMITLVIIGLFIATPFLTLQSGY
jgi:hypothetical protein